MLTKKQIQDELRRRGCKTSFPTRALAQKCLDDLRWFETFPWHTEQQEVLSVFKTFRDTIQEIVVQGIFGNGKTTLMLGLFSRLWWNQTCNVDEIVMCAFNVCIKNELTDRLRRAGIKKRPMIRTVDSLVYTLCERLQCPHLDKPNYEGRRRFLELYFLQHPPESYHSIVFPEIQWCFLDEAQDLDNRFYWMLRTIFPSARFIFFGDVFQCIQKEPRSSLLWNVLSPRSNRVIFKMTQTPRVPIHILEEMRGALISHYPEHQTLVQKWTSMNQESRGSISWKPFRSYTQAFRDSLAYVQKHGPDQCMVLVFSSAITVRGGCGDVARFRKFYQSRNIPVNTNYKRMDHQKLFLSTVNSSKGLERPYVFLVLTFPLEQAFANFSNDLVVNLISVGLSRCKKDVVFCVPSHKDRFSRVLSLYPSCPQPDQDKITVFHGKKSLCSDDDQKEKKEELPLHPVYQALDRSLPSMLQQEHSTTEVIRQSIISYDTRLQSLRSTSFESKTFPWYTSPEGMGLQSLSKLVIREEDRALLGILMEQFVCCAWKQNWPDPSDLTEGAGVLRENPIYAHCKTSYLKDLRSFCHSIRRTGYREASSHKRTHVLHTYSRCLLMLQNRVNVSLGNDVLETIVSWHRANKRSFLGACRSVLPPQCPIDSIKYQQNLKMPCLTGIADACVSRKEDKSTWIYEIKACFSSRWFEDALFQAYMYFVMNGKKTGKLILLNPIRNEVYRYSVQLSSLYKARSLLYHDLLLWNTNCFFAKYKSSSTTTPSMSWLREIKIRAPMLLGAQYHDKETNTTTSTVLHLQSSTQCRVLLHQPHQPEIEKEFSRLVQMFRLPWIMVERNDTSRLSVRSSTSSRVPTTTVESIHEKMGIPPQEILPCEDTLSLSCKMACLLRPLFS